MSQLALVGFALLTIDRLLDRKLKRQLLLLQICQPVIPVRKEKKALLQLWTQAFSEQAFSYEVPPNTPFFHPPYYS